MVEPSRITPRRGSAPDDDFAFRAPTPARGRRAMPPDEVGPPAPGRRAAVDSPPPVSGGRRFALPEENGARHSEFPETSHPGGRHFAPEPDEAPPEPQPDFDSVPLPRSEAGLSAVTSADHDEPQPKDRPRHRWLIPAVGVTAVAVVLAGWFYLGKRFGGGTPSTATSPSPTLTASPDAEDTSGAVPATEELKLNDTAFNAPAGWSIYGDEVIETDRRVVRLTNTTTDLRLQVATLATTGGGDVAAVCESLSASQQSKFSDVTTTPTLGIGIDPAQGAGVTCGFHGTRTGDSVPATVSFTVVVRVSDGHALTLRSMIPDALTGAAGEQARGELAAMNCSASRNFQVTLPLC